MSTAQSAGNRARTVLRAIAGLYCLGLAAIAGLALLRMVTGSYSAPLAKAQHFLLELVSAPFFYCLWLIILVGVPGLLLVGIWTSIRRHQ